MSYQDSTAYGINNATLTKFAIVTGGASNTQVQTVIETLEKARELNIIFQAVSGGNFASQSATVEVSNDNSTFYTIDSGLNLGTGTLLGKGYSDGSKGTTLVVNPAGFKYVRVTIPAIVSITTRIVWSIK